MLPVQAYAMLSFFLFQKSPTKQIKTVQTRSAWCVDLNKSDVRSEIIEISECIPKLCQLWQRNLASRFKLIEIATSSPQIE